MEPFLARGALLAIVLQPALSLPAGAVDLGGHWYVEQTLNPPSSPFFEWSPGSGTVTVPVEVLGASSGGSVSGTIAGSTISIPGPGGLSLNATILAADGLVDGMLQTTEGLPSYTRFLAHRCECFDSNEEDGDGCDAQCRLEPCFTCTGDPSSCGPSSDGAACNDRRDCTTGETCTAGACGGGSAVAGCIDLTGRWKIITAQDQLTQSVVDLRDVVQRDGIVRLTRPSSGVLAEVGTINSSTGEMHLGNGKAEGSPYWNHRPRDLNATIPSCDRVAIDATADAAGASFSGSGQKRVLGSFRVHTSGIFPGECEATRAFDWSATRCADGACQVLPDSCPPCQRPDGAGGCEVGPREGCLASVAPGRSSVQLVDSNRYGGDKLRWKWRSGESFDAILLGNPSVFSGMQVCVFDESSTTPQLLFATWFNPAVNEQIPDESWTAKEGTLRFQRETYAGKESASWSPSDADKSSISIQGRGESLGAYRENGGLADGYDFDTIPFFNEGFFIPMGIPHSPLPLPVRVQARMDFGGACFESIFGPAGVKKNDGGAFVAKATQ